MVTDTKNPDRVLMGHTLPAVLIALAGAGLGFAPRGHLLGLDRMEDSLDTLGMIMGDDGYRSSQYRPRRELAFIDTPKPLSKRRARRLRGKAAA